MSPSPLLSTFHITLSPSVPSHSHLSASVCFSASPFFSPHLFTSSSSFTFSPAMPSISPSPRCASLSVSASSSLSSSSFYVSIASSCLLTHHMNGGAVNNSGVTPGGVTRLSRSCWMCMHSIFRGVFKTTNLGRSSVRTKQHKYTLTFSPLLHLFRRAAICAWDFPLTRLVSVALTCLESKFQQVTNPNHITGCLSLF